MHFEEIVSSQSALEKGRCLSLEPCCLFLFVLHTERTKNKIRFREMGIMIIKQPNLTNQNPYNLKRLGFIFVFSLRLCRQIQVIWLWCTSEVTFLRQLRLFAIDRKAFILTIQDRQFSRIYYLCLFFSRILAETLSVH